MDHGQKHEDVIDEWEKRDDGVKNGMVGRRKEIKKKSQNPFAVITAHGQTFDGFASLHDDA